jgi:hypothetical protein
MVAVIKTSHSIHRILNYNENKVRQKKAVCMAAGNYPTDASRLSFTMKLRHFERQMDLNANAKRNSVHISLNFDASEKDMPTEKVLRIAEAYMEKIGFGEQPYLVYRHFDAGHPHIHLVTTNITSDGSRIDLHHLAIRKSEPARKEIEIAFGLVRAQGSKKQPDALAKDGTAVAVYGASETRAAIQNVLEAVINKYRFTSLPEFNAVLQLYNVKAEQGGEGSRVRRHGGLLYRILDSQGNPVGVPIKASLLYNSPTLAKLSLKFSPNAIMGQQHKARVKNAIDRLALGNDRPDLNALGRNLSREGISMVMRTSHDGLVYGITYVDHRTGGVFNGSALGKPYSAKQMQQRFPSGTAGKPGGDNQHLASLLEGLASANPASASLLQDIMRIAEVLSRPEQALDFVPGQLKKRRKRQKKGPSNNH